MPAVHFSIVLPDGSAKQCYSPSTVVRDYFVAGDEMSIVDFLARSRSAFKQASARVQAKYGYGCPSAAAQLEEIELWAGSFSPDETVRILTI